MVRTIWRRWKKLARRIGDFQARLIFSFIYFIVALPFVLLVKWLVRPFFSGNSDSSWQETNREEKVDDLRRQY